MIILKGGAIALTQSNYTTGARVLSPSTFPREREIRVTKTVILAQSPSLPLLFSQREQFIIFSMTAPVKKKRATTGSSVKSLKSQIADANPEELEALLKTLGFSV